MHIERVVSFGKKYSNAGVYTLLNMHTLCICGPNPLKCPLGANEWFFKWMLCVLYKGVELINRQNCFY